MSDRTVQKWNPVATAAAGEWIPLKWEDMRAGDIVRVLEADGCTVVTPDGRALAIAELTHALDGVNLVMRGVTDALNAFGEVIVGTAKAVAELARAIETCRPAFHFPKELGGKKRKQLRRTRKVAAMIIAKDTFTMGDTRKTRARFRYAGPVTKQAR